MSEVPKYENCRPKTGPEILRAQGVLAASVGQIADEHSAKLLAGFARRHTVRQVDVL